MFGLFKKESKEPSTIEADYRVVANLRIGATLTPQILNLALAKEEGEPFLFGEMDQTLVVNSAHHFKVDDVDVYRYLCNSGEMVEISVPPGTKPEESTEIILYHLFDNISFGSDADFEAWMSEGQGLMGEPHFRVEPESDHEKPVDFHRMLHPGSGEWSAPIVVEVTEHWGDPYDDTVKIEKEVAEHSLMLYARDINSINSHEQLLMDFDENSGVIKLYVGLPVTFTELDIT